MCGLQVSVLLAGLAENIKLKGIPRRSFCSGFMNFIAYTELCEIRNMIYWFLVQLHFKLQHSILCLGRPFKKQKEQVQMKKTQKTIVQVKLILANHHYKRSSSVDILGLGSQKPQLCNHLACGELD